jgi:dienelactone hydrolase
MLRGEKRKQNEMRKNSWLLIAVVAASVAGSLPLAAAPAFTGAQEAELRKEIRANFFVPDPLPATDAVVYRTFSPTPGVKAEAVSYTTQFGVRVPAILYLPDPLPKGKIPAFVVVTGHGGDKYSWYAFYTGILFARAGAAVLTYDQIGEGERNSERKSGTRSHDQIQGGPVLARHLAGLMITDVMQAVSYLRERPEVDANRIAVGGYSLGSFVVALTGAVDTRIHACVMCAGGNLDGPGGYWDTSGKKMCQAWPYQSLNFLGDRAAVIYALQAARGPAMVFNGLGDTAVAIPTHGPEFFKDLQARATALNGGTNNIFECGFAPKNCGHRPYWLTRPVVAWLEKQINFPNWTEAGIEAMPEIKIGDWAETNHVFIEAQYATDLREGGTPALDAKAPGYPREMLDVLTPEQWAGQKTQFIMDTWLVAARKSAADQGEPSDQK